MMNIRQLAKIVDLSPATVSIVLNSSGSLRSIPEETRRRVREAAEKYGYSPNPFARSLFSKRSRSIAILVSDLSDPYCTTVLKGICGALRGSHYLPVLLDNDNSAANYRDNIKKMVERRIEGIIGVANSSLLGTELFTTLKSHPMPIVLIGRDMQGTGISSVTIDNEAGARLAVEHLYTLGHRRIAFIRGPSDIIDSQQRWDGMAAFALQVGLKLDPGLSVRMKAPGTSYEAGYQATQQLLSRRRKFTALATFDDSTAFGAIRALVEVGWPVPARCSIVGFDDVTTASYMNPPLTTVRQPMEALGSRAVEIFLKLAESFFAEQAIPTVHDKINAKLIVRASTSPIVDDAV